MDTRSPNLTAVIIDRHPLWLEALDQLLNRMGLDVLARGTRIYDARQLVEEHRPDVLVMEFDDEHDRDQRRACEELRNALEVQPDLKAIVISDRDDLDLVDAALGEGASAYCKKSANPDDLAAAIRQSFEKSIHLARARPANGSNGAGWNQRNGFSDLTRREVEILRLVAEGYSNSQLAKMLWVTEQTIKFHLSNVYRKLGVSNRTEASRWAQLHGLLNATPAASANGRDDAAQVAAARG
jgi:DNA-binding NarL/FixJ family response regulator